MVPPILNKISRGETIFKVASIPFLLVGPNQFWGHKRKKKGMARNHSMPRHLNTYSIYFNSPGKLKNNLDEMMNRNILPSII